MKLFEYKAINCCQSMETCSTIEAENEEDAANKIRIATGLIPVDIKEKIGDVPTEGNKNA